MLTADEVARAAGLELHRRGQRQWACCPLHGEKTPSMCFYPDGRYHCFGCHAHGDAADLYQALHGCSIGEALRAVDKAPSPRELAAKRTEGVSPGEQLRRKVEAHKSREWDAACAAYHAANAALDLIINPDSPALYEALKAREQAARRLDFLQTATDTELLNDLAEVRQRDRLEQVSGDGRGAKRPQPTPPLAPSGRASRPASA